MLGCIQRREFLWRKEQVSRVRRGLFEGDFLFVPLMHCLHAVGSAPLTVAIIAHPYGFLGGSMNDQ